MRGHLVALLVWILGGVHESMGRSSFLSKSDGWIIDDDKTFDLVKEEIVDQLSQGGDPCEDFYAFTCGEYIVNSTKPSKENKLFDDLASLADESTPILDSTPKWKRILVTFMKRCTAHRSPLRNDGTVDPHNFRRFATDFGGWDMYSWYLDPEQRPSVESLLGHIWRTMGVNILFRKVEFDAEKNEITLAAATQNLEERIQREAETSEAFDKLEEYYKSLHEKYSGRGEPFNKLVKAGREIEDAMNSPCPDNHEQNTETISVADVKQFNLSNFLHDALTKEEVTILESGTRMHGVKIRLTGMTKNTLENIGGVIQRAGVAVSDWVRMRALVDLYDEDGPQFYLDHVKSCFNQTFHSLNLAATRFVIDETMENRGQLDLIIMSTYIKQAFSEHFSSIPNISDATRIDLLNKLANLRMDLGWPRWITNDSALDGWYAELELREDMSLGHMRDQLDRFLKLKSLEAELRPHLHSTVHPNHRISHEPNAVYQYTSNSLYIYPGIMILPGYSPIHPAVVNFGGVGATIGHEIGHAFDPKGLGYDYNGRFRSWIAGRRAIILPDDKPMFEDWSNCLIDHYNQHCLDNGTMNGTVCNDGAATAAENEADVLGTRMAFRGFQLWLEAQGGRYDELHVESKYSDEQLFFLSYARAWCRLEATLDKARMYIAGDEHALPPFRVIGAMSQTPGFQQAFNCTTGQRMAPKERCGFRHREEKPKIVNAPF